MQHLSSSGETNLHLKWSQNQDLELGSRRDLHNSDSALGAFISHNRTSSCAIAKLSLLVCISIFTTLPDLLMSVMAYMQSTLPFRQLYSLYITYNPINQISKKQIYTNTE
jgi:hypothetical protein